MEPGLLCRCSGRCSRCVTAAPGWAGVWTAPSWSVWQTMPGEQSPGGCRWISLQTPDSRLQTPGGGGRCETRGSLLVACASQHRIRSGAGWVAGAPLLSWKVKCVRCSIRLPQAQASRPWNARRAVRQRECGGCSLLFKVAGRVRGAVQRGAAQCIAVQRSV